MLHLNNIAKAQGEVLGDKSGPNENIECKLGQLKLHERTHLLYESGKLTRKNLFSHYLHGSSAAVDCPDKGGTWEFRGRQSEKQRLCAFRLALGRFRPAGVHSQTEASSSCAPSLAGHSIFWTAETNLRPTKHQPIRSNASFGRDQRQNSPRWRTALLSRIASPAPSLVTSTRSLTLLTACQISASLSICCTTLTMTTLLT